GRFRTASRPSRTVMSFESYDIADRANAPGTFRQSERGRFGDKTAGQRPEYHLCKSTRGGSQFRRRRTSTRSTTPSPKASRNLPSNSASKNVNWVAQAGSVTATTSTPDDRLRGRA